MNPLFILLAVPPALACALAFSACVVSSRISRDEEALGGVAGTAEAADALTLPTPFGWSAGR
jgi:hypothetical protein